MLIIMTWTTVRIPSSLLEEVDELVLISTYPNSSQFISEAIREKITKVRDELERKHKIAILLNEKGDIEEVSQQ